MKILVADKLSLSGVDWLAGQDDVEVDVKVGMSARELAEIVGEYDGMIIRSGVKVTAEVLAEPGRLKCIARAGVGVDNVDVPLATARGIVVMNTPGGNTLSTAELTMTLMMALSRKIAPANASLRSGKWDRKAYQGTQLAGKTLGIVGLGRIGRAVATRAAGFDMRILGYDPFLAGGIEDVPVEIVKDLGELCRRSDYITVHVPKGPQTVGMIGREQFSLMKPTVRLINAARGGIIDPEALLEALNGGKVAGAALDVYQAEPPDSAAEKALVEHENVLAVPHLGASTAEAQEQVALDASRQLVEFLRGGAVRNALNAPGFDKALGPLLRPYVELAERMGTILTTITPGALSKVEVIYRGAIADQNVTAVTTHLLTGLLGPHLEEPVNVINAPVLAEQRGIEVRQITSAKVREFANLMEATIFTDETKRSAVGTIFGIFGNRFPRILSIDGFHMEMKPQGHVLLIFNDDMPGVVGRLGTILGQNRINIADMMLSRKKEPAKAVMGISLDSRPDDSAIEHIRSLEFVNAVYYLDLPELPAGEGEDEASAGDESLA